MSRARDVSKITTNVPSVYATDIELINALTGYITSSTASAVYLSQLEGLAKSSASSTYLTQTNASSTYLTQPSASATYLTQSSASTTYAPRSLGVVALATSTTQDTSITSVTDLNGMSVTFTGVAGRRYKVTAMLPQLLGSVNGDRARISITDGSNNGLYFTYAGIITHGMPIIMTYFTTAVGSTTFKVRGQRDVGSGNIGFYADSVSIKSICVEDIGAV